MMGKAKAKSQRAVPADDSKVIGASANNVLPIKGRRRPGASAATDAGVAGATSSVPEPAVIVFGRDEGGKPHASTFGGADAELAIRAAGVMRFKVLPITADEHRAAAAGLPQGRIFASGRAFSPFCREAAYGALEPIPC